MIDPDVKRLITMVQYDQLLSGGLAHLELVEAFLERHLDDEQPTIGNITNTLLVVRGLMHMYQGTRANLCYQTEALTSRNACNLTYRGRSNGMPGEIRDID